MTEHEQIKQTRHPISWQGEIGNKDLEQLADSLIHILNVARYSRRYHPLQKEELSTSYGRELLSWLRENLNFTPFGISYLCEDEVGKTVKVKLGNGEIKESKLYATAGVYALYHYTDGSIVTFEVGIVASFEDLIKIYSFKRIERKENWDDLELTIKQRRRSLMFQEHYSEQSSCFDEHKNRPIIYSAILCDDLTEFPFIEELQYTGFPCSIDRMNQRVLCLGDKNKE